MKQSTKLFIGAVVVGVAASCVWHLAALRTRPETEPAEVPAGAAKVPLPEDIVGERMDDTNYVATLKGLIDERSKTIAEAHAVRGQMEAMLVAAEKVAGASSSPAQQQAPEQAVSGMTERELEAPSTMAATNAPLVSTNTALQAGMVLSTPDEATADRFAGINPALLQYVRQQPEWPELEARLDELAARQQDIQIRTRTLIRERMDVQYAARAAESPAPITRTPYRVIKPMTNAPDFKQTEPVITTNAPPEGKTLPPLPDRKPVK